MSPPDKPPKTISLPLHKFSNISGSLGMTETSGNQRLGLATPTAGFLKFDYRRPTYMGQHFVRTFVQIWSLLSKI
jgi:hypothetical protein